LWEVVLAAPRRTAEVAGLDWKSAVYRPVAEEVTAGRRRRIEGMVEPGRVSRSGVYRGHQKRTAGPDPDMEVRHAPPAHRVGRAR
jgi:hypothetical protein